MSTKETPGGSEQDGTGRVVLQLRVKAESRGEIDQLTADLYTFLQSRTEAADFERRRENAGSQDAGTLLVALLTTPVAVQLAKGGGRALSELAKGIAEWMRRRNVSVAFSADGVQSVEGPPEQVERILRELLMAQARKGRGG